MTRKAGRSHTVLVLDDDEVWLNKLVDHLRKVGFSVRSTRSGAEAIEIGVSDQTLIAGTIDEVLLQPGTSLTGLLQTRPGAAWRAHG